MGSSVQSTPYLNNVDMKFQRIKEILLFVQQNYDLPFFDFNKTDLDNIGLDVIENNKNPLENVKNSTSAKSDKDNNLSEAAKIWNSISDEEKKAVEGKNLLELDSITKKPKYKIAKGSEDNKYHIYNDYGKCVVDVERGNNYLVNSYSAKYKKVNSETENYLAGAIMQNDEDIQGFLADIEASKGGFYLVEDAETQSPLIVDYNGDGKVSAQAGMGIDIDGDGKADGAATGGDKMLAMSDINGNGKIDGAEVFGNKTVNPFTGEAINAKNGFDALKEVALYAEKYSGKSCIEGDNVNLKKLQKILLEKGVKLGFVSGTNNSKLEKLSKIEKINIANYTEHDEYGDVQHRQQGSGTNSDGKVVKVDDVWFKTA